MFSSLTRRMRCKKWGKKYPVGSGPGTLQADVGYGLRPSPEFWEALPSSGKCLQWLPTRVMPGPALGSLPIGEILPFRPDSAWFHQPRHICWGFGFGFGSCSAFSVPFPGGTVRFADAEHHAWFDPTLWQDVLPSGELKAAGPIFSVDEERVPCRYDDVIFQPQTSFRVNTDSSQPVIRLRSISVMGQVRWGGGGAGCTPSQHSWSWGSSTAQGDGAHPWGCCCCCGWPRWLFAWTSLLLPPSLQCGSAGCRTVHV